MSPLRSLQNRIFLASAVLTVLSMGVALYLVSVRINQEAARALQADLVATGSLVTQLRTTRAETFTMMARLAADAPKLKAAVDTNDPPTVQDVADEYQERLRAHLLVVTNRAGQMLAHVGTADEARSVASHAATADALAGHERFDLVAASDGIVQLATVPIALGLESPDVLGALSLGFLLDDTLAHQLKSVTGSDVAFGMDGQVLASTLPLDLRGAAAGLLTAGETRNVTIGAEEFVALAVPLASGATRDTAPAAAAVVLRSRTDQLRLLREIYTELAVTAVLGVLLATLLSFVVARTITRPLAAITAAMRDVAATGDLTRKIAFRGGQGWQDEDARLLATTFNTLTESIARFQREGAQKERLSSLGRLSTVIAHEIRNPLMIIKSALRPLRQAAPASQVVQEAISDIDGEVARLNGIVNEVLDFARPIKYALAPTDVNVLVQESAAAAQATPGPVVHVSLDPSAPVLTTDAERVRLALVNLIVNARQAVDTRRTTEGAAGGAPVGEASPGRGAGTPVTVTTRVTPTAVRIAVTDTGPGIEADDLSRIFDPYFSTKRGGTGLGLPIAKNIVEGLGGTLTVTSTAGRGTEMRIDLPRPGPATSRV
jgi:signal transduction histidine kinase